MKIFDLTRALAVSILKHEKDYSTEYAEGYKSCLSDIEERLKDAVEVKIE